jgi:hypothetical protein
MTKAPEWRNPHEPLPKEMTKEAPPSILERAAKTVDASPNVHTTDVIVAAVVIAEALDRLGAKLIEAAAISSRPRS